MTAKLSCASILFLVASSAPALLAQDNDDSNKGKETTVTCCLSKGAAPAQYSFKDDATGKEMTVTGPSELDQHAANHTVKLTGTSKTDAGTPMLNPSKMH